MSRAIMILQVSIITHSQAESVCVCARVCMDGYQDTVTGCFQK